VILLVDRVLGQQPVHVDPPDLAHPVRPGDRLLLDGRVPLRLADDDDRGGLDAQPDPARLDLADEDGRAGPPGERVDQALPGRGSGVGAAG
jgi:hypothetical protein